MKKKILYTLCFFVLMLIDWSRGSQVGSTWAWTTNMTGIVMAVILFSAYPLKDFRKPVYYIYSIICLVMLSVSYLWWTKNPGMIYRDKLLTGVINIWLLGILLIRLLKDIPGKKNTANDFWIKLSCFLLLFWMFLSKNEDVWPIWYLVMFGMFYTVDFPEESLESLYQGMLYGIILGFFVLQGLAFVFRPYDDPHRRYCGMYANGNMTALFFCIVWVTWLVLLYHARRKRKKIVEVISLLFSCALGGFMLLTMSRTAWVSAFLLGILYIILVDFMNLKYRAGRMLLKILLFLFLTVVSVPIVYGAARYIPAVFHHPIWYEGEYSENRVHSFDPWDSEKYVSWEEVKQAISERTVPYFRLFGTKLTVHAAENMENQNEKITFEDAAFSSARGRLMMWKYYLARGTLLGHRSTEGHDMGDGWYIWHAQNMFIQLWYYYGIPSAIFYALYIITVITGGIKKALEGNRYAVSIVLFLGVFLLYGLFEAVWYPSQMILFLAFFLPKFILERDVERG